jgi:uncharacterized protein (TIGR03083 family)
MSDRFAALLTELRASQDRLLADVGSRSADELTEPSYHSWTVAEVLSHVGSGSEIFRMYVEAGVAGTEGPTIDDIRPVWDRWNAMSPVEQRDEFVASVQALHDAVDAVPDPEGWRLEMYGGEQTLPDVLRMRLGEHAVHSWDVLVTRDRELPLHPDSVALMADESLAGLVTRAGHTTEPTRVRVETTDPKRSYLLTTSLDGGSLTLDDADDASGTTPADDPDAAEWADAPVLRLPAEAFVRLLYGRLDPDHTPASVEADGVDLDRLRTAFPGF